MTEKEVFIKICGITSISDAEFSLSNGADAIGLVLTDSKRQVSVEQGLEIRESLGDDWYKTVGVFAGQSKETIADIANSVDLETIQVHDANDSDIEWLSNYFLTFRAVKFSEIDLVDSTSKFPVVVDSKVPGSGKVFDWNLMKDYDFKYILAGGLNPENVASAIELLSPWGVDVSSGVSLNDRDKDYQLIQKFISEVRRASHKLTS